MRVRLALCSLLLTCGIAAAEPAATESVQDALCRLIENAAREHGVPADFLTSLLWRESSFRAGVVSPKGAQGIAQFMPSTAIARGLLDPFDPEEAIPQAARLISDLTAEFGNLGLAAAAYNAGPARVSRWLRREALLPAETRAYVELITGRTAEEWATLVGEKAERPKARTEPPSCSSVVLALRRPSRLREERASLTAEEAPVARWGVQLAGDFSKDRALVAFSHARERYARVLGDAQPMVIGTLLRSRGTRAFYRVRVPAASRNEANTLCNRIRASGGACVVLRS
jgi:Transglycosylase SLT domain/SPOR domain